MCCCMTLTGDAAVLIPARRVQVQGFSPPRLHCGTCDDCQCCSKWDGSPAGRKRGKQLIELFPSSAAKIHPLHPTRTVSQASVNHNHIRSSGTSVRKFPFPLLFFAVAQPRDTHTACQTTAFTQISHVVGYLWAVMIFDLTS